MTIGNGNGQWKWAIAIDNADGNVGAPGSLTARITAAAVAAGCTNGIQLQESSVFLLGLGEQFSVGLSQGTFRAVVLHQPLMSAKTQFQHEGTYSFTMLETIYDDVGRVG